MQFLLLLLVGLSAILFFLWITKAPSATGVSSSCLQQRQGKRVRITLISFYRYRHNLLRAFTPLSLSEVYLLLTQSMTALRTHATVEQFEQTFHWTELLDTAHTKGHTEHTLHLSRVLILWCYRLYRARPHHEYLTWEIAHYMLLHELYQTICKTIPSVIEEPIILEEEPEEMSEEPEPVLAQALQAFPISMRLVPQTPPLAPAITLQEDDPLAPHYQDQFYGAETISFEQEEEEEEEQPLLRLNEYLRAQNQPGFLIALRERLRAIYLYYYDHKTIIQASVLAEKILSQPEWKLLLEAGKGLLWKTQVIELDELGDKVITVEGEDFLSLVETYVMDHWHELII
jgi:hypothetical protein